MEITAQDLVIDDLEKVLSLTVDQALQIALQSINEYKELDNALYTKILSKLNELEQDAFTMALATNGVIVIDKKQIEEKESTIEVPMEVEVTEASMSLEQLQEKTVEEEKNKGELSEEFYDELLEKTDEVTASRYNCWLSKTGMNLKKPITDHYKKKIKRLVKRKPKLNSTWA